MANHTCNISNIPENPKTAPAILDKAAQHMRDRAATYDTPGGERSMAKTVQVFNAFHDTNLTEEQGWHMMQILKDVRFFTSKTYHADSAEDAVAYAGLKAEARAARDKVVPATSVGGGFVRHESRVPGELAPPRQL